jgi:hypothetical protein
MTKRTYHAPAGATSITVNGKTYEVDTKGKLHCDDEAAHADLLSHGYTFGDAPVATALVVTDDATLRAQLDAALEAVGARTVELDAREAELDRRDVELAEAVTKATEQVAAAKLRGTELDQRAADLANRETDLTMRLFAVEQREVALAASAPPPPPAPPADGKPAKGK